MITTIRRVDTTAIRCGALVANGKMTIKGQNLYEKDGKSILTDGQQSCPSVRMITTIRLVETMVMRCCAMCTTPHYCGFYTSDGSYHSK